MLYSFPIFKTNLNNSWKVCVTKLEIATLEQSIVYEISFAIFSVVIAVLINKIGKFPIICKWIRFQSNEMNWVFIFMPCDSNIFLKFNMKSRRFVCNWNGWFCVHGHRFAISAGLLISSADALQFRSECFEFGNCWIISDCSEVSSDCSFSVRIYSLNDW